MINYKASLILPIIIFKIITSSGDNLSEAIVKTPCLTDVHTISWQNLTQMPWVLSESSKVSIMDDKFPIVDADVDVETVRTIDLSHGKTILYKFTIAGESKEKASDDVYNEDVKSVLLSGKGMWLVDETTKEPIAGRFNITRNVIPSLWVTQGSEKKITEIDEISWMEAP